MSSPQFADLGLDPSILSTIRELGYEQPSPIQAQSIPLLLAGKNLLGVAQTGTGKTGAFALPLLSKLDPEQRSPQILVLTPTRELAIQVAEACQTYARGLKGFHVLPVYGGQDMVGQLRALKRGAQVVVGTPGRIMDHLRRQSLDLSQIRAVVLDEADEMLRMGFIDDVETILSETPDSAQRALFSATMPAQIQRIANKYLGDAEQVHIASKTRTVERIRQRFLTVNGNEKLDALTRILEVEDFDGMIVFVRTKSTTVELAEKLEARGFSASALNGDLNQQLRERTIQRLKDKKLDIVVATDVAARGLDVERISHVVNFDIPYDNESYVHRIGRTGRAGRDGEAILFVTHREKRLLRSIEKSTGQPIESMVLPGSQEVSSRRIENFRSRLVETLEIEDLGRFRQLVNDIAAEREMALVDISAAMAFLLQQERPLFPALKPLTAEKPSRDGDRGDKKDRKPREPRTDGRPERGESRSKGERRRDNEDDVPMQKYRLDVGRDHGVQPGDIVGAIANEADIDSQFIGRIKIHDSYSTVDLPEGMPRELLQYMKKVRIRQQAINMQPVDELDAEPRKEFHKAKDKPRSRPPEQGKKRFGGKDKSRSR
ncbi:MAG: DEAD/DEAH box helicase [Porticoccaceae bacterium]|nr:DEAD/DEAH box helicase [Porticoccaceae bacterium]